MKKILIAAAIIFCAAGLAQAVMIDDFNDNDPLDVGNVAAPSVVTTVRTSSNIIGSTCNLTYEKKAGFEISTYLSFMNIPYLGDTGFVVYNADRLGQAVLTMEYGKNSDLNAALNTGGAASINIDMVYGDLDQSNPVRPIPTTITLISGRGTAQQASSNVTLELLQVGTYHFPFTSFTGINFADVDYIKVTFDGSVKGQTAHNFIVSKIYTVETPTAVELADFKVISGNNQVTISWETNSETDNSGFNLYRLESQGGEYIKINASLIPAQSSATRGASYEFVDTNVQNRKTYYYKLEDMDLNGTTAQHRPKSATPNWLYSFWK